MAHSVELARSRAYDGRKRHPNGSIRAATAASADLGARFGAAVNFARLLRLFLRGISVFFVSSVVPLFGSYSLVSSSGGAWNGCPSGERTRERVRVKYRA